MQPAQRQRTQSTRYGHHSHRRRRLCMIVGTSHPRSLTEGSISSEIQCVFLSIPLSPSCVRLSSRSPSLDTRVRGTAVRNALCQHRSSRISVLLSPHLSWTTLPSRSRYISYTGLRRDGGWGSAVTAGRDVHGSKPLVSDTCKLYGAWQRMPV
jgi:hypothetical protein